MPHDKQRGSPDEFLLLASIDCVTRLRECLTCPTSHFDKRQAIIVQHHQVNFTAAKAKVSCKWLQPSASQVFERQLLRALAYSSGCGSSHGDLSAASGMISSLSRLIS